MRPITTITIKKTTQNKLKELGKKSETYDNIILKLLNKNDGRKR